MKSLPHFLLPVLSLLGSASVGAPVLRWDNPPLTRHGTYESAAMKVRVGYNIYLPPGYGDAGNQKRYPVIYWLHGAHGNENSDIFLATIAEKTIREGTVPPLIEVFVNGGDSSLYADSADGKWLVETTFIKELIPHIDSTYRTLPTREGRAIQGMSMGGAGALKFALKYPELFSSVVAFSASDPSLEEISADHADIFKAVFGSDPRRYLDGYTLTLLSRNLGRIKGKLPVKLYCGEKDYAWVIRYTRMFHSVLDQLGVENTLTEVPGADHMLVRLTLFSKGEELRFAGKHFGSQPDISAARGK